ncbi:salicylate hydroxylase [Xylaria grammica]|nr:salicylate hydroxylase [Xylaria grammica]
MHWWSYYLTPPKARTGSDGLRVGIIGAGIGGMAAAVAMRYAGVQVTVLEAAEQLGDIGAGIQVTPNVSVLLQTWGVDKVIGDNLVQFEELNMRRKDGTRWVVHRAHLHEGLALVAERLGAKVFIDSAVEKSKRGEASGINSITRKALFPDVAPEPPTTNCAYRALVPYEQIRKDPVAKELIEKLTMEVRMGDNAYIITYPISAGKMFNLVLSHHTPEKSRWPLMVTGPLKTWSSPRKNVVLMGDAAHSMVNHMAQGAATAMEDGAFLAKCLGRVVSGDIRIGEAVTIYERERLPKAYEKQQVSFLNGAIWHLPDGLEQRARDAAMNPELEGKYYVRSSNLYGDQRTVLDVYGYDSEKHAETALAAYLSGGREPFHPETGITQSQAEKYMSWFAPSSASRPLASKL